MKVPYTILGGCGSKDHIKEVLNITHSIGIAAGSYFVFNETQGSSNILSNAV